MGEPVLLTDSRKPGSDEAFDAGCTCARIDNHHGRGYGGNPDTFVISGDCPLHGFTALERSARRAARSKDSPHD